MVQDALPSPQRLRSAGANALPWLESCFDYSPVKWCFSAWPTRDSLPQANREALASRLAEMAFWRTIARPEAPPPLPPWLLDVKPFADANECLRGLLPQAGHAAMAVFPLAGRDGRPPELARLYLLSNSLARDSRPRLSFTEAVPEKYSVLLATPSVDVGDRIDGDSWQLDEALARLAMLEPALRVRLGADWVCTGAVNSRGKVEAIELGNKPSFAHETCR